MMLSGLTFPVSAAETRTVSMVYSGTAEPNTDVSFMVIKASGDFASLKAEDLYNTEIVRTDDSGEYSYIVELVNAEFDDDGKITNYKLKSSIKGIDINSGRMRDAYLVKIDGVVTDFTTPPMEKDGVVYVPISETFEKLGVTLSYNADKKTYTGTGNNGDIEIVMGKDTVEIDWVDVEMPAPSENINDVDMIPLYIIEDAVKTKTPVCNKNTMEISIVKPIPGEGEESTDIGEIIKTLPEPAVLMSNADFIDRLEVAGGSKYVDLSKSDGTATITTHSDSDGNTAENIGEIQLRAWSYAEHLKGNTGLISFDIKLLSSEREDGNAVISFLYQRTSDWIKTVSKAILVKPGEWQTVYLPVYSEIYDMVQDDWPHVMLNMGGQPMSVEIKNFSFVNYGTDVAIDTLDPSYNKPYKGIEEDALWRKEAYRRIEKYRKNDMNISVVDENGNPIKNAEISADMTKNEYMFGVSLCENEVLNLDTSTKSGAIYNELINNSFNTGVCGLEMKEYNISQDDAEAGIKMVNEFLSRGKRMRGHAILWDGKDLIPIDKTNPTYDELYKACINYARDIAYTFKGKLAQWDVYNEPTSTTYMRGMYNSTKLQADMFKEVRKVDPDVKLYVNETGIEGKDYEYEPEGYLPLCLEVVKQLKREGAPVDGIGIQAHCTQYYYPQGFYHQIDECASVVDEVSITEYDLLNEKTEYADEHLRDTLLATFSHPKTTAFVIWGVQDTMHWRNAAPFYDREWNKRPALDVWNDMVQNEFATHETAATNDVGNAVIRGFRGDYDVKCKVGNSEYTARAKLTKDGENKIVFTVSGNSISAKVSNVPDEKPSLIEYKDRIEAKKEYYSDNDAEYDVLFFNKLFEGSKGIENDTVLNGSSTVGDDCWNSQKGMSTFVTGSNGGVYIKSPSTIILTKTADLSHKFSLENRPAGTDVALELDFDTLDEASNGKLSAAFTLNGNSQYSLGTLVYNNGSYSFKAVDGTEIALDKNMQYTLRCKLVYSENGYSLRYDILNSAGNVIQSYTDTKASYADISDANELSIAFSGSKGSDNSVFRFWDAGIRCTKNSKILDFGDTIRSANILNESMRDFEMSSLQYMGTSPSETSTDLLAEGTWGLYSQTTDTDAFKYESFGRYLYAMRNAPNGENYVVKKFTHISDGDTLTLNYNMYLNGSSLWYDSSGKASVLLGDKNNNTNIEITSFEYDPYNAFWVNILGEKTAVSPYTKNNWNKTELNVTLRLEANESGSYDAYACVTNNDDADFKYERTVQDALTAEQAQSIDSLFILSQTGYSGTRYGSNICGFKNMTVEKTTAPLEVIDGKVYCGVGKHRFEIPYENATSGAEEVNVIAAVYKNNVMSEVNIIPYTITEDDGKLMFDVELSAEDDYIKIFLWDNLNNITPVRNSDTILISD